MSTQARVLIVDDDPGLLQALSEMLHLRMRALTVETSVSASEALDRLNANDYDAIVADIKMPGMDGIQLLERIRELRPETPTLPITGHGEHELAVQALRGGASDYVQKPIDREYFVSSLNHAIERRRLSRKVLENKQTLEKHSRELEDCLDQRTNELRELYQREALARAELEKTTAELQAARQRRIELVSVIAHELATPLTTLRGYAELLTRPNITEAVRDRAKSILLSETGRMERLVQDLVEDSDQADSGVSLRLDRCDLAAIVREQIELAGARSRRHSLVLEAPRHLESRCDAARLAQVVANLLANAIKYTSGGEIQVALRREGDQARLSIRDEGPGIPADSLTRIFEPRVRLHAGASRTRRHPNGKGLGLSIAREIVEAHGGRIWAESTPGQGASFNVLLPTDASTGAQRSGSRRRVAVDKLVTEPTPSHKPRAAQRPSTWRVTAAYALPVSELRLRRYIPR
jgi:two-component system, sensor histidine kinase and response regulator